MGRPDLRRKRKPMDSRNTDATWNRLGSIVQLLHQAATQVWIDADETAASPLEDFGLGVYLVHSRASALLPGDYELPDVAPPPDLEERTPLQLLIEAEKLTWPLPLHRPDLIHSSQLVVDLCDLIREARSLGY